MASTILTRLYEHASSRPDATALTWCGENGEPMERWSYAELLQRAQAVHGALASSPAFSPAPQGGGDALVAAGTNGASSAPRVLLLAPQGLDYVAGFYGALLAGVIPVTLPAPRSRRSVGRVRLVAEDCSPVAMLVTQAQRAGLQRAIAEVPVLAALPQVVLDGVESSPALQRVPAAERPEAQDDIAFLQYTSGSTSQPKGVMVTHANLAHQCGYIGKIFGTSIETSVVSWLPLNHDMGLIGSVLAPLIVGGRVVLLPPAAVLQRPLLWLETISQVKANQIVGPDFIFAACVQAADRLGLPSGLDLSMLKVVANGAEPVQRGTLERFTRAFAPAGFRPEMWLPCYGMAETTLMVTGHRVGHAPVVKSFCAEALGAGSALAVELAQPHRALTSCGKPQDGMEVAIVAPETLVGLPEDRVGEIWVRGESVAAGYFGKEALTQEVFRAHTADGTGPWLRTGDLGFLHEGKLHPCGRLKDMIKLRGRNLYPQDIEAVIAAALPWLAPNGCAAFVVDRDGVEAVGILIESDRASARAMKNHAEGDASVSAQVQEVLGLIRQAVTEEIEAAPALIAFTGPADFPRTTSGKVQRSAAKLIATTAGDERVIFATGAAVPKPNALPAQSPDTPMPDTRIDSILTALRAFGERRLNSRIADERRTFPPHVILDLAELGIFGMRVAREFGGLGLSWRDMLRISQQIAAIDVTLAIMVGIHNGLGLEPIAHGGSETVKRDVLPVLASGRGLAAFALTEYGGGSNPRALTTVARRVSGGFVISGHKLWIGIAAWARTITVVAQAVDEAGRALGVVTCLVHRDNPGLLVGDEFLTLGMRAIPQNHVDFVDAFVPERDILGSVGEGWKVARKGMLSAVLGISTIACGAMKRCTQLLRLYATQRHVSGGRLLDTATTRERLDWMVNAITTADAFFDHCSTVLDGGGELHEAFYLTAKTTLPEWLGTSADWTLQALGGAGYTETNEIARIVRDARILRIFEGPSEALLSHLGALARRSSADIHAGLTLLAGDAAADLIRALDDLVAAAPQADNVAIGRCTAETLLLAAVLGKHGTHHASVLWQQKRCRQIAEETRNQPAPAAANDLEQSIASFEADIGSNRIRRAPGEDHEPHPFLKAEPLDCGGRAKASSTCRSGDTAFGGSSGGSGARASAHRPPPSPAPSECGVAAASLHSPALPPHSTSDLLAIVQATLLAVLRDQLDNSITQIDPDSPLTRYGMDSLATAEAAVRLEEATGRKLPPDILVQTQTAREVARLLVGEPLHASPSGDGSTPPHAKAEPFPQRMAKAMERVNQLRAAGRYPYHRVLSGYDGGHVFADGQRTMMLGSYDYLNILDHPLRVAAAKKALDDYGTGGKGAPILAGRTSLQVELERRLASLMNAEDAIVYTGGYITNVATVATIVGPGDVVVGDALNHASIVDGCRHSGARFVTFAHNDLAALERLLAENAGTHTLVVVEGVFSMDGDIGNLPPVAALCRRHGAYLMMDEAHSLGVIGAKGRGVQEHFGLPADAIDLKMGTLSKALGGVGGFIAGKADVIDYMRHQSRGYLFSGALPPPNAAASIAALDVLEQEPWRVERVQANARRWRDGLKALGYDTFASETPIVPVRMPDETAAFEFAHRCKERGVFVVPVVFPAVPQNAPRLRTCVTAGLTDADLDMALEVFAKTGREMGIIS